MDRRRFVVGAAGLVLAPRAFAQSRAGTPVALVTADLESRLVAVHLGTGRVLRHVETGPSPRGIETVGDFAVATHFETGAVTIVHGPTLEVTHALRGWSHPRYTAAHPDGRHAFVTDAGTGEVVVVDVVRGRVLARTRVGAQARHLAIAPNGRTLWVALGAAAREIAVVDVTRPAHPRLLRRFAPPFHAHDVGWSPDGKHIWVSSADRWELAVYDARAGRVIARPSGDQPPQHVTFAGGRAYVTSGWSGTLRVHRVDGRELRTNVVPVGSYNVQHGGGRVVTASLGRGTLTILDENGRTLHRPHVARSSHDACIVTLA
jgi:DNA-binding beta-propeller fold protein YncE